MIKKRSIYLATAMLVLSSIVFIHVFFDKNNANSNIESAYKPNYDLATTAYTSNEDRALDSKSIEIVPQIYKEETHQAKIKTTPKNINDSMRYISKDTQENQRIRYAKFIDEIDKKFDAQELDTEWSMSMEQLIYQTISSQNLELQNTILDLACKSTICKVSLRSSDYNSEAETIIELIQSNLSDKLSSGMLHIVDNNELILYLTNNQSEFSS